MEGSHGALLGLREGRCRLGARRWFVVLAELHSAGLEARPALGRGGHAAGPTHGLHLCSMATLIMALLGQHDKYINIGNFLSLNFKNGKYL